MTPEEEIAAVLQNIGGAFSRLDFSAWLACFHSPRMVFLADRIFVSSTEAEFREVMGPMFARLKAKGFKRTQLDVCNVQILTDSSAVASTVWTRFDSGEQVIERLGATYMFSRMGGKWKVATLAGHSPETVVVQN
jgi:hypothetical protein